VQITNPPASLRPGISASVSIIVNRAVHVLTVPTAAVHTTTAGSTVQVLSGVTASSVSVQLGAQDPTSTQILSGLSAGQQVVIATISSAVPTGGSGNPLGGGRTGGGRTGGAGGGAGGGGGRTGGGGQ
jgi:macrolide-specific efflux system membrane fusion protein